VLKLRREYKPAWGWGPGAKFLYRTILRAYGLTEHEKMLMDLAKPKRGRKKDDSTARLVATQKGGPFSS
jgi:hypothetical protein